MSHQTTLYLKCEVGDFERDPVFDTGATTSAISKSQVPEGLIKPTPEISVRMGDLHEGTPPPLCGKDDTQITLFSYPCFALYPPPPCISYTLVQATVGVGTVLIWDLILIRYQT